LSITKNICVCLAGCNFDACLDAVSKYALVELRLDMLPFSQQQVERLLCGNAATIVTCRAGQYSDAQRMERLAGAIKSGADYVDIEIESPADYRQSLIKCAKSNHTSVIISYHNFELTPSASELQSIIEQATAMGADIVKIATMAHSAGDAARIMSLYADSHYSLVAFAMGEFGKITRIVAPLLGAPFTYATLTSNTATASGQFTAEQMMRIYSEICPKWELYRSTMC
jgi:3-dehydroquinate dehydratase-1